MAAIEVKRRKCTLTADGYEPFVNVSTGGSDQSAAELTGQIWLLGHPERRSAKNIQIEVEDA